MGLWRLMWFGLVTCITVLVAVSRTMHEQRLWTMMDAQTMPVRFAVPADWAVDEAVATVRVTDSADSLHQSMFGMSSGLEIDRCISS